MAVDAAAERSLERTQRHLIPDKSGPVALRLGTDAPGPPTLAKGVKKPRALQHTQCTQPGIHAFAFMRLTYALACES
jgi:hypothetical protein